MTSVCVLSVSSVHGCYVDLRHSSLRGREGLVKSRPFLHFSLIVHLHFGGWVGGSVCARTCLCLCGSRLSLVAMVAVGNVLELSFAN